MKDGHVHYQRGGTQIYPYQCPRLLKDQKAFSLLVVRKYFENDLFSTNNKACYYGILSNNIGYVYLPRFGHTDDFSSDYATVLDSMKNTKGLIIDLRNNPGGNANNIKVFVAGFINKQMNFPPSFRMGVKQDPMVIQPTKEYQYNNSLVVLINGASMSGADLAPEIFKQLPNVTAIGDTTAGAIGILSDRDDNSNSTYYLPSGKSICIPTGYFLSYDGRQIEWNGVIPDILIEQTEKDIAYGNDKQLEYAISYLNDNANLKAMFNLI